MPNFKKKPVVIEAEQFTDETKDRVLHWANHSGRHCYANTDLEGRPTLSINTLEGIMTANLGDWVIKGISQEFYPCKDPIFRATYEAVDEDGARALEASPMS